MLMTLKLDPRGLKLTLRGPSPLGSDRDQASHEQEFDLDPALARELLSALRKAGVDQPQHSCNSTPIAASALPAKDTD